MAQQLTKREAAAAAIVERHFRTFANSPPIKGHFSFTITDVLSVTPKVNKTELARRFSRCFVFLKLDTKGNPIGLRKFKVSKQDSREGIRLALPLLKGVKFFVTIAVKYKGRSEVLHAIVKRNAKPSDFKHLIDPLTPSPVGIPTIHHSKLVYRIGFAYRSGTSCHFEVDCTATCDGSTLRTCAGGPTLYNDSACSFNHLSCDRSPIRKVNDCCEFTYQLQMEYGLSDVEVTYQKNGFKVKAGHFSQTILKVGPKDMNDCCPPKKAGAATGVGKTLPSSSSSKTGDPKPPKRETCKSKYPRELDCVDDLDSGFKYEDFDELQKHVEKAAGEPVRVIEKPQDKRGPCPGKGKHYDFIGVETGDHHGSAFGCRCCDDSVGQAPELVTRYKYNG
jgi:hypothetical protein